MHYELTDLRLFLAIAEEGNLTHGAAKVHLAPSSASHRLSRLEEALGTTLFERQARGVTLTGPGEALLRHARTLFAQLEQMHADLAPYARGIRGHVRLWANSNATSAWLPDDLASFLSEHPQVSVSLEEQTSANIVRGVLRGEAEVGVVARYPELAEVDVWPYRMDRLVLVTPPDHRVAQAAQVRFQEVLDEPFVSLETGSAIHTFMMNTAAGLGQRLNVRIQVKSFDAVCRMAGAGVGIGMVPLSVVRTIGAGLSAAVIALDEPWAERELVICAKRTQLSPFAAALVQSLTRRGQAR